MFARIVVIQLLNQKCIIYISRTITLTVLHSSNFMTKDTSSSPTLILQACYCRLIRLELEISFNQFNFYVTESNRDSLSTLSLYLIILYQNGHDYFVSMNASLHVNGTYGIEPLQYFTIYYISLYIIKISYSKYLSGIRNS